MSLESYDKGLMDYLRSHLNFNNIVNSDEDSALSRSADMISDPKDFKIKLPMISFWRTSNNLVSETGGNFRAKTKGRIFSKDKSALLANEYREIEIAIDYQLSIWSATRRECDDIFREVVMLLLTDDPHIPVYIPGMESPEYFDIVVTDTDTSLNLSDFDDKGRLYRQIINIELPDARLVFNRKSSLVKDVTVSSYTY